MTPKHAYTLIFGFLLISGILVQTTAGALSLSFEEEEVAVKKLGNQDIHGFADVVFKNDYITSRGLLVTDEGLTIQVSLALILDVYKNNQECAVINEVSVLGGIWNDICTCESKPATGGWVELDWFFAANLTFYKNWKFTAQFVQFVSPPDHFAPPENNAEFTLYYDDSNWGCPVVVNPYVRLWWAISGDSTVVVGRRGNTYYVEFGMIPTLDLTKKSLIPVIFFMPTWISVGPASYWNGGPQALKNEHSNWGVASTGIKAKIPLNCIPERLGNWYFDFGFQYYYLINDNLLQAQTFTLNLSSIREAKRNVVVGFAGLGFEF